MNVIRTFTATLSLSAAILAQSPTLAAAKPAVNCDSPNVALTVARDAVAGLIALADVPEVVEYYGGISDGDRQRTLISIEPRYRYGKDWYHLIVRNADCRVMAVELRAEGLQLDERINTAVDALF